MVSRAVHLVVSNTLETDLFLNALRRFICRRVPVCQLHSDQGTNSIGAKWEFHEALQSMDQNKISAGLLKENCNWMTFKMNPPVSQSSRKSMGMPDQDNLLRIISPIGEKWNYLGWRILSYADLWDQSDHEQPPAVLKWSRVTISTNAKSYPSTAV